MFKHYENQNTCSITTWGFPGSSVVKNPPANSGDIMRRGFDPWIEVALEEEMANHSSILAWKIPRTVEPVRLQSMGWQRGGHKLVRIQQQQ